MSISSTFALSCHAKSGAFSLEVIEAESQDRWYLKTSVLGGQVTVDFGKDGRRGGVTDTPYSLQWEALPQYA